MKEVKQNFALELGQCDSNIKQVYTELEKIVYVFNRISDTIHKMLHYNTIVNHLLIQDEIDKNGISLYGIKQSLKETDTTANLSTVIPNRPG